MTDFECKKISSIRHGDLMLMPGESAYGMVINADTVNSILEHGAYEHVIVWATSECFDLVYRDDIVPGDKITKAKFEVKS